MSDFWLWLYLVPAGFSLWGTTMASAAYWHLGVTGGAIAWGALAVFWFLLIAFLIAYPFRHSFHRHGAGTMADE